LLSGWAPALHFALLTRVRTRYNPLRLMERQKLWALRWNMYLLILDSLGNTELLLILVAALDRNFAY
jgi:hypothetical protein